MRLTPCRVLASLLAVGLSTTFPSHDALAQPSTADLFEMSVDELASLTIVSASKKKEELRDAPLSSFVITRDEIRRAGATSIPEALRLSPAVIVREETNGVYDIHLRGFDNIPPTSFIFTENTSALVMVDNRIVYNYVSGGTFWETLHIDIHDVERIEIVVGPSSALYGPNAATGVINILTTEAKREGVSADLTAFNGSSSGDFSNTSRAMASINYKGPSVNARLSVNGERRDRFEQEYYDFTRRTFVKNPADLIDAFSRRPISQPEEKFPHPGRAMDRFAANAFLDVMPSSESSIQVDAGIEDSYAQNVFAQTGASALSTRESQTRYGNARFLGYGFDAHVSYLDGDQNTAKGLTFQRPGVGTVEFADYDLEVFNATLEYSVGTENFEIRPLIGYQEATYKGVLVQDPEGNYNGTLESISLGLRAEATVLERLRLIGAVRGDDYEHADEWQPGYQAIATYKFTDDHIGRVSYGSAKRSPFVLDTRESALFSNPLTGVGQAFLGNEDLDLLTINTWEVGYRGKIVENAFFDAAVFLSKADDYTGFYTSIRDGRPETIVINGIPHTVRQFQNIPLEAEQLGLTASLAVTPAEGFEVRPFITLQDTDLEGSTIEPAPGGNVAVSLDGPHKSTPDYYGGLVVNYSGIDRLNVNLSSYYYGSQDMITFGGTYQLDDTVLTNLHVNYQIPDSLVNVFGGVRNVKLVGDDRQFGFADQIEELYILGLDLKL